MRSLEYYVWVFERTIKGISQRLRYEIASHLRYEIASHNSHEHNVAIASAFAEDFSHFLLTYYTNYSRFLNRNQKSVIGDFLQYVEEEEVVLGLIRKEYEKSPLIELVYNAPADWHLHRDILEDCMVAHVTWSVAREFPLYIEIDGHTMTYVETVNFVFTPEKATSENFADLNSIILDIIRRKGAKFTLEDEGNVIASSYRAKDMDGDSVIVNGKYHYIGLVEGETSRKICHGYIQGGSMEQKELSAESAVLKPVFSR